MLFSSPFPPRSHTPLLAAELNRNPKTFPRSPISMGDGDSTQKGEKSYQFSIHSTRREVPGTGIVFPLFWFWCPARGKRSCFSFFLLPFLVGVLFPPLPLLSHPFVCGWVKFSGGKTMDDGSEWLFFIVTVCEKNLENASSFDVRIVFHGYGGKGGKPVT